MEVRIFEQKGGHRIYQDALAFSNKANLKMIICDGHGASQYCRSNLGAKIALKAAMAIDFKGDLDVYIKQVHEQFLHLINKHLDFRPLTELEINLVSDLDDHHYVYGTTFLGIVEYHQEYFAFRIGDGYLFYQDDNYQWINLFNDNSIFNNTPCSLVQKDLIIEKAKLPSFNSLFISSDGIASLYGIDFVKESLYRCQLNNSFQKFVYDQSHFSHKNDDCSLIYLTINQNISAIKKQHHRLLIFNDLKQTLNRINEIDYLLTLIDQNKLYFKQLKEERQSLKNKLKILITEYQA